MAGVIGTQVMTQVGFIVRDVEATKKKFAEFFGVEVPPHFDGGRYEVTQTVVEGEPAPEANCL
ncbi:MAG: VOC family protein, partial [Eubacteriales bacterium]|nr:VOC family protein [Eubacteriales bacterium]